MSEKEPEVKTFDDWLEKYIRTPRGSEEEAAVLAEMTKLATTREQWQKVFTYTPLGSPKEALTFEEVAKRVETFEDAFEVFESLLYTTFEAKALEILAAKATTRKEWETVKEYAPIGSEIEKRAQEEMEKLE